MVGRGPDGRYDHKLLYQDAGAYWPQVNFERLIHEH